MSVITNFISRFFDKREAAPVQVEHYDLIAGPSTHAGPRVTEASALRYGAVWACVRIIAESIASLPLLLYEEDGRGKKRAIKHPLYTVLHDLVNPWVTSYEWRETAMGHVNLWGNHWSEIEYDDYSGEVKALWPLRPDKMERYEKRDDGSAWWYYRLPGGDLVAFPAYRIHHIRGFSIDGVWGMSPIRAAARQAAGLGLAMEEYGARFFSNSANPGGFLKHPGKLTDKAYNRLREEFNSEHQGLSNAHRMKILEEGMDYTRLNIPNNDAQFLESRKFQVTEIARIFRVPPHMLADLERATFSNIEHQGIGFVIYTLMPWLTRHEQAIYRDMLKTHERKRYSVRYLISGLLRGDVQARYAAYNIGIQSGFMTRNEARELEDLNPIEGLDDPLVPMNMIEVGMPAPKSTPTPAQRKILLLDDSQVIDARSQVIEDRGMEQRAEKVANNRQKLMRRAMRLFEDATERATKREVADIRRAVKRFVGKRSVADFESWLESFYQELREWLPDYFRPIMESYAEEIMAAVADELDGEPASLDEDLQEWITRYLENFTSVYAVGGEKQLKALIAEAESEEDAEAAINDRLDGWEENRASKTALDQAFEAGNALAIYGYAAAAVVELVWRARGDSCPLCKKMDGRKIPIKGSFLDKGDTVEADGVDPLPVIRKIKHGPLHQGCDCVVTAA